MLNWLKAVFHFHKWKTILEANLNIWYDNENYSTGRRYYQQCEICGKLRKVDLG